jgi:hypothetical protein
MHVSSKAEVRATSPRKAGKSKCVDLRHIARGARHVRYSSDVEISMLTNIVTCMHIGQRRGWIYSRAFVWTQADFPNEAAGERDVW